MDGGAQIPAERLFNPAFGQPGQTEALDGPNVGKSTPPARPVADGLHHSSIPPFHSQTPHGRERKADCGKQSQLIGGQVRKTKPICGGKDGC